MLGSCHGHSIQMCKLVFVVVHGYLMCSWTCTSAILCTLTAPSSVMGWCVQVCNLHVLGACKEETTCVFCSTYSPNSFCLLVQRFLSLLGVLMTPSSARPVLGGGCPQLAADPAPPCIQRSVQFHTMRHVPCSDEYMQSF